MPGENLLDWSVTAANNANADSSINWTEGQPRASVNNSSRSEMAAVAKWRNLQNGSITTGGSANAQTFTSGVGYSGSIPAGLSVLLKIGFTNTGATTLNMDGIGAVTVKTQAGEDLVPNALIANGYGQFVYNGTNWILLYYTVTTIGTSAITLQKFTASGTYTPTAGTQFIIVECIGGGGSGAAAQSNSDSVMQGGGGGSGGYSRSMLTAAAFGSSQVVTIGAGGVASTGAGNVGTATSFGALCIANGGGGGALALVGGPTPSGGGGAAAGTGDIAVAGTPGGWGMYVADSLVEVVLSGDGAAGPFGGGGLSALGAVGGAGTGYGAGGAGGNSVAVATITNGGAGAAGLCIVTEYNIAVQGPQGTPGTPGLAGGVTTPLTPQGRLTLLTATPVMSTTQSAKTTIFYSPYCGNQIPIYNGTSWATQSFNEISAATTDTTKSPAAIGASKVNDWFVWDDGGTLRIGHGPDWTNDTTRSAGTALVRQNGLFLNSVSITNGPAASRGTYVGTTRSNASSQLDWIFGASAAGGTAAVLGVWNAYNRSTVTTTVTDATANWSYTSSTARAMNNSNANRISFVAGLAEDGIIVKNNGMVTIPVNGAFARMGIALDATNVHDKQAFRQVISDLNASVSININNSYAPQIGFHFVQATESSDNTNASTFNGGNYCGLHAILTM